MPTIANYRLDILRHVDRTHGGDYWVWSLIAADGDQRESGRVADLCGTYDLDGGDKTMDAERVADEVCHMLFGVDADRRTSASTAGAHATGNMLKLGVAVGMIGSLSRLPVALK